METQTNHQSQATSTVQTNKQSSGKSSGQDQSINNKLTDEDLKGKQVDEDPSTPEGKPLDQLHHKEK